MLIFFEAMSTPQWTPPTQVQLRAADQYVDIIVKALKTEKGIHSETPIAAAAAVLSEAANVHGPLLMRTFVAGLNALKVKLDPSRLSGKVPEQNQPHLSVNETQSRVETRLREVSAQLQLSPEQCAHACALAAARLVQMSAAVLDPHIGFSVAAYGFVEGAKTAPIPLSAR